jgi:pilus assembly protein Flp/PilA
MLRCMLMKWIRSEKGATMVEYGLMVALIAAVCIAAVTAIGTGVNAAFEQVKDAVTAAA